MRKGIKDQLKISVIPVLLALSVTFVSLLYSISLKNKEIEFRNDIDKIRAGVKSAIQMGAGLSFDYEYLNVNARNKIDFIYMLERETKKIDSFSDSRLYFLDHKIQNLSKLISEYKSVSETIIELIKERGFRDFGLEGKLRVHIHAIEDALSGSADVDLKTILLSIRRYEKDFLLRKDTMYVRLCKKYIEEFKGVLPNSKMGDSAKNYIKKEIRDYAFIFNRMAEIEGQLGLKTKDNKDIGYSLKRKSNQLISSIDGQVDEIYNDIISRQQNPMQGFYVYFSILIISIALTVLFIVCYYHFYVAASLPRYSPGIRKEPRVASGLEGPSAREGVGV